MPGWETAEIGKFITSMIRNIHNSPNRCSKMMSRVSMWLYQHIITAYCTFYAAGSRYVYIKITLSKK
jgi:hypothetical protein